MEKSQIVPDLVEFKLVSWLLRPPGSNHKQTLSTSNKLSCRCLQPGLHTINPLSMIRAPKDLPSQNFSCVVLSDPASLIPLAVHLPSPMENYRSYIPNPCHSCENKYLNKLLFLLSVILHVGQIYNKDYDRILRPTRPSRSTLENLI
ncbi:hypothetical protein AMECASPLE_025192 [Ameca splendens]|uniref:Uncharacterized protein n=1 Tax=Ameca splendens TaxID=208324 RepID=A0ABV0YFR4_9TELE